MDESIGPEEDAFLQAHSRAFLIGLRADGSPTGWPMVGFYADGALEFSTYGRSQKVRDFERNPSASCVIGPSQSDRALVVRGTAAVKADQRGPSTGDQAPLDVRAKVQAVNDQSASGLKNDKRVILRFTPAEARFVPGFAAGHDKDGS